MRHGVECVPGVKSLPKIPVTIGTVYCHKLGLAARRAPRNVRPRMQRTNDVTIHAHAAIPAAAARPPENDPAKRALDLVLAAPLLVLSLPLMALIALLIRLDSRGPALYRQERLGQGEKRFVLLKFRTMRVGTPTLPTDEMVRLPSPVTRVGALLRRTSLDELPQLLNVLRGEMSLVGPRPALPGQADLNARRRDAGVHRLLPGITGWAQVNGRDDLDTESKVAFDAWYARNRSLRVDLGILGRTLGAVFSGRGSR